MAIFKEDGKVAKTFGNAKRAVKDKFYNLSVWIHKKFHKTKKEKKPSNKSALIFYISFMAIPILQFAIFWFGVNINSILLAFKRYDGSDFVWYGFKNIENVFNSLIDSNGILNIALGNSLKVYCTHLIIGVPCCLFFSYYVYKKMFFAEGFKVLLFMPSILSQIVIVTIFKELVQKGYPEIVMALSGNEVPGLLSVPETTFSTVLFYDVWTGFGTSILMYTSAMSRIPKSVVESCEIDGAGQFTEFLKITLPLIYPTITTFLTTGIIAIFTSQACLHMFYGDQAQFAYRTIGYHVFIQVLGKETSFSNYPEMAALGVMFSLIVAPVTLLIRWLLERVGPSVEM